jgi:hypothetical protein
VTIPLAPRIARAIDLAVGERCDGPIFLAADGRRLDRHGAARIVRRAACRARISVINGTWWRRQQAAIQVSFCGRGRPRSWGLAGQLAPQPSYLSVMRHDRSARRPGVQAVAPVLAPPADHRPLRQLAHGDKGQPDPRAGELAENPPGAWCFWSSAATSVSMTTSRTAVRPARHRTPRCQPQARQDPRPAQRAARARSSMVTGRSAIGSGSWCAWLTPIMVRGPRQRIPDRHRAWLASPASDRTQRRRSALPCLV